ncbi:MAG TPA: ParB N-terminal domain-containing protein [Candidatus Binatia bacterium]|nr:ParB N-terminal domain-containing protein [Candidatus Binatia bacterium]
MAEKKATKKSGAPRKRRKPAGRSTGLASTDLTTTAPPGNVDELRRAIERDGGTVLSLYREPYGGQFLLMAALPIDQVEPTPYQRNLSDSHVRKLESVIAKLGRFLDPIIVVRGKEERNGVRYWTPNGNHRLSAMRTLGAKSITAIVVPEPSAAYQILALNTEKAHNLRERALEVIKMYQELATLDDATEDSYGLEFEEAALITLGLCYLERPRFSGGAYHPILRRSDAFLKKPLRSALEVRQQRAKALMALDEIVVEKVDALKARGLTSPYLKTFVVARINPIRFRPKDAAPLDFEEVMDRMVKAAAKLNVEKVKIEDLAKSGGAPEPE